MQEPCSLPHVLRSDNNSHRDPIPVCKIHSDPILVRKIDGGLNTEYHDDNPVQDLSQVDGEIRVSNTAHDIRKEVAEVLDACRQKVMRTLSRLEAEHLMTFSSQNGRCASAKCDPPRPCSSEESQTRIERFAPTSSVLENSMASDAWNRHHCGFSQTASVPSPQHIEEAAPRMDRFAPTPSVLENSMASTAWNRDHCGFSQTASVRSPQSAASVRSPQQIEEAATAWKSAFSTASVRSLKQIEETAIAWKNIKSSKGFFSRHRDRGRNSKRVSSHRERRITHVSSHGRGRISEVSSNCGSSVFPTFSYQTGESDLSAKSLLKRQIDRSLISSATSDEMGNIRRNSTRSSERTNISELGFLWQYFVKLCVFVMIVADISVMVHQTDTDLATVLLLSEEQRGNCSRSTSRTDTNKQPENMCVHEGDVVHSLFILVTVLFSIEFFCHACIKFRDLKMWPPTTWIIFDFIALACSWLQMSQDANLIVISRLGRALRLVRMRQLAGKFLKSVKNMMFTILYVLRTIFPVVLVLLSVFFFASLAMLSGVQVYAVGEEPDEELLGRMNTEFGSLETSMRTFIAVFVNFKYNAPIYKDVISHLSFHYIAIYEIVWFVVYYVVVNVIVGEISYHISEARKPTTLEILAQMAASENEHAVRLLEIMRSLDTSKDGVLSREELDVLVKDPFFATYLNLLDVSPSCILMLFESLHCQFRDGVDIEMFVEAVLANRGVARRFEVSTIANKLKA